MANIRKHTLKDGSAVYEIRVSRGRDPVTGKPRKPYVTRFKPPEGYSSKRALREAQIAAAQFEADCRAGTVLTRDEQIAQAKAQADEEERVRREAAAQPTFSEYMALWLRQQEKSGERAANTLGLYRKTLAAVARDLGDYKMVDVDRATAQAYVNCIFAEGVSATTGNPLAYGSKEIVLSCLQSFFRSAAEDGVIPASPMDGVKKPKRPKGAAVNDIRKAFTADEARRILECAEKESPMHRALIVFMLDSGCRSGEAVGLKWEDVDLKTGTVTISRNAQYTCKVGVYITTPKNGRSRAICLNPQALAVMRRWKQEQAFALLAKGLPQAEFCFTNDGGTMIHPHSLWKYFRRFGELYNIPDFHPHKLRHTMASLAIANGADILSVSRKLGHTTASITLDIYAHASEESQRRANAVLADIIYGTK